MYCVEIVELKNKKKIFSKFKKAYESKKKENHIFLLNTQTCITPNSNY